MTATFDTNAYWLDRGKSYIGEQGRLSRPFYRDQERFFCDTVADFRPGSILEVGCGFGRLTKALRLALSQAIITAIDISADQIANAKKYCGEERIQFTVGSVTTFQPINQRDVAVACELFLHVPDPSLAIVNLLESCPVVIHDYDPSVKPGDSTGPHCFAHDYERIYSDLGLSFVRKIRGEHGLMVVRRA